MGLNTTGLTEVNRGQDECVKLNSSHVNVSSASSVRLGKPMESFMTVLKYYILLQTQVRSESVMSNAISIENFLDVNGGSTASNAEERRKVKRIIQD